jgi:hypothetical protein
MSRQQDTQDDDKHNGYKKDNLAGKFNAELEGRWSTIQQDYRKHYPNITEEDVTYRTGEFDLMTEKIAKRTNRSRDQIADEIKNWKI